MQRRDRPEPTDSFPVRRFPAMSSASAVRKNVGDVTTTSVAPSRPSAICLQALADRCADEQRAGRAPPRPPRRQAPPACWWRRSSEGWRGSAWRYDRAATPRFIVHRRAEARAERLAVRDEHHDRLLLRVQRDQQIGDGGRGSASRLPVGSSHSISRGLRISARAIAARCFSPPDNSAGPMMQALAKADLLEQRPRAIRRGRHRPRRPASAPARSRAPCTAAAGSDPGARSRRRDCETPRAHRRDSA